MSEKQKRRLPLLPYGERRHRRPSTSSCWFGLISDSGSQCQAPTHYRVSDKTSPSPSMESGGRQEGCLHAALGLGWRIPARILCRGSAGQDRGSSLTAWRTARHPRSPTDTKPDEAYECARLPLFDAVLLAPGDLCAPYEHGRQPARWCMYTLTSHSAYYHRCNA